MRMLKKLFLLGLFGGSFMMAHGQVTYKVGGRLFVDGGVFMGAPDSFSSAAEIADIRLTTKVQLGKGWKGKLDVSFADKKVKLKDAYLQKTLDEHVFRAGHFGGSFSIEQVNSSNENLFMTPSNVCGVFGLGRRVGASYSYVTPCYYASVGAFVGDELRTSDDLKQGMNATFRMVYRPVFEDDRMVHVGAGAFYRKPDRLVDSDPKHQTVVIASGANTTLATPDVFNLVLTDSKDVWQWNVETISFIDRFFVQGEYLQMLVNRTGRSSYKAQGAYIQGGYVLKGGMLGYDTEDAIPLCASEPHSLLAFTRFNVTDLNDAEMQGGVLCDLSFGMNYYLSKNIIFRLNYSHMWASAETEVGKTDWGLLQTRIQLKF